MLPSAAMLLKAVAAVDGAMAADGEAGADEVALVLAGGDVVDRELMRVGGGVAFISIFLLLSIILSPRFKQGKFTSSFSHK